MLTLEEVLASDRQRSVIENITRLITKPNKLVI